MKQRINKDDVDLFRDSIGDVKPVSHNKVLLSGPKHKKRPAYDNRLSSPKHKEPYGVALTESELQIGPNDYLMYKKNGIQDKVFKRLRKGQLTVIAELDLHGYTIYRAKLTIERFLQQIRKIQTSGCVRIIHGKGLRSQDATPVIKQYIPAWLQENNSVLAYCSCIPSEGGTGAVYVLLKKG